MTTYKVIRLLKRRNESVSCHFVLLVLLVADRLVVHLIVNSRGRINAKYTHAMKRGSLSNDEN